MAGRLPVRDRSMPDRILGDKFATAADGRWVVL